MATRRRPSAVAASDVYALLAVFTRCVVRSLRRASNSDGVWSTQDLALQQNIQTLRNRVNELGVSEPRISQLHVGFAEASHVTAFGKLMLRAVLPVPPATQVDYPDAPLVLDLIEQLPDPEKFMGGLRKRMARGGSEVIITVSNGAFAMKRVLRALSAREAKRPSASDASHRRVFTFKSLQTLLGHAGYEIVEARGVPAPFTQKYGRKRWTRALLRLNECLLKLSRQWFAYEICVRARPLA